MKVAIGVLALGAFAFAQEPRPTFEVASVKPGSGLGLSPRRSGESVTWRGATLGFLVQYAYDVAHYQIEGLPPQPGQPYDIEARVPMTATATEVKLMFRSLLEDRFALKIRPAKKDMKVLELVTDAKGHRLKSSHEDAEVAIGGKPLAEGKVAVFLEADGRHLAGKAATIAQLLDALSGALGQPVVDKTGLTGLFDFDVLHGPEDAPFDAAQPPSIRAVLQETLGLRLRAAKAPVDIVVIESIGPLTEN